MIDYQDKYMTDKDPYGKAYGTKYGDSLFPRIAAAEDIESLEVLRLSSQFKTEGTIQNLTGIEPEKIKSILKNNDNAVRVEMKKGKCRKESMGEPSYQVGLYIHLKHDEIGLLLFLLSELLGYLEYAPDTAIRNIYIDCKKDRSELGRLLMDAKDGKINAVIVYSLSDLADDLKSVLEITTEILPRYEVECISIEEEYDSTVESLEKRSIDTDDIPFD